MKCPHCTKEIFYQESDSSEIYMNKKETQPRKPGTNAFEISHGFCPACRGLLVLLREGYATEEDVGLGIMETRETEILYPKFSFRPLEPEVPQDYRQEFGEAAGVLEISPKASAAISRRLFQHILRDELGVKHSTLFSEINEFISRTGIPSHLSKAVDAVRNLGNIAAHPVKETNTGVIADVSPGEAEWLLEVLEALFDFVFVQPSRLASRKKKLNEKLASLGKPKMKGT